MSGVNWIWRQVLLLNSPNGPRTKLVQEHGIVWRDTVNVMFNRVKSGPIQTAGWMRASVAQGQTTVIAVTSSHAIAFVAAGPPNARQRRAQQRDEPMIFSWNQAIPVSQVQLTALLQTGQPLSHVVRTVRPVRGGMACPPTHCER